MALREGGVAQRRAKERVRLQVQAVFSLSRVGDLRRRKGGAEGEEGSKKRENRRFWD